MTDYDVVIIGSGIAGLSAAVYTGRASNDTLVLHGDEPGGQLTLTSEVANYPGFEEPVNGTELINKMQSQAESFGAELEHGIVETVQKTDGVFTVSLTNGDTYTSRAVISASGSSARTLEVPGEEEYMGYGVSTCATCDGAFFRGEDMVVVGGGDAALEEAVFLTKFADTVYIVHRRDEWRAEQYLVDRVQEKVEDNEIEVVKNTEVIEILGDEEEVTGAKVVSHPEGYPKERYEDGDDSVSIDTIACGAIFYAIGHTPNTSYLEDIGVPLNEEGYLEVLGGDGGMQTATTVDGLFGAGDVVDYHYQQAATASGMGVKAALDVDEYLESNTQKD